MKKRQKERQFIFLSLAFLPISFVIDWLAFNTMLVFFAIHALIIGVTIKKPGLFRKVSVYSLLTTIVLTPIIQHLAFYDKSWFVPSMIPRFVPEFSLEDFVSVFLMTYAIVALYEYFCDREVKLKFPKQFRSEAVMSLFAVAIFIILRIIFDLQIVIPYFYILIMTIAISFVSYSFIRYPFLIKRCLIVSIITLPLYLVAEYFSVLGGAWVFPGDNFIGNISILKATFPVEELLFLVFSVPAIVCAYELTADDKK